MATLRELISSISSLTLHTLRVKTHPREGHNELDHMDESSQLLPQFVTPAETSVTKPKTPGIHYLIAGYPAERNSIKHSIAPLATHLVTGDIKATVKAFPNKSDDFHFALGHPGKTVPTYTGNRFRVPKVQGMSGGGIWRLEIDIRSKLSTSPLLVGIGIEYYKTKQVFVATRVQAATPLLDDLFNLEQGLPTRE